MFIVNVFTNKSSTRNCEIIMLLKLKHDCILYLTNVTHCIVVMNIRGMFQNFWNLMKDPLEIRIWSLYQDFLDYHSLLGRLIFIMLLLYILSDYHDYAINVDLQVSQNISTYI